MEELNVELLEDEEIDITADITDDFLKGDKGDKGEPGKDGADYDDSELRTLIQNNTKDINNLSVNKAEKTEVETLNTQVQTNTDNISNLDSIKANKEDLNNTNTQVLNNKTDIEILNENKADKGAIPDVSQFITDEEVDVLLKNLQANLEEEIGNVSSFDPVIVEELPTENIQEKTMYLVLSNADEEIKKYDAYIYKDNEWKQIGSAELDPSKLTVNLVENSYDLTLTEAVTSGGTITLPSMYKVGFDRLDVYLNGEKLIKADTSDTEGHYYEVGTEGTLSNVIRITSDWTAEVGDVFEFTIRTNGEGAEVESDTIIVSNTEPITRQKVWFRPKGKNLINVNNVTNETTIDATTGQTQVATGRTTSEYIPVSSNTTYTVSNNGVAMDINIIEYDGNKNYIRGGVVNGTFTTSATTKYIRTFARTEMFSTIQIEEGTVATAYEEYIEKRIYILNSNNEYELFI